MYNIKLEKENIGNLYVALNLGTYIKFTDNYFYNKELNKLIECKFNLQNNKMKKEN